MDNYLLHIFKLMFLAVVLVSVVGCDSDTKDIDKLFSYKTRPSESGGPIRILYSDSAKVLLKIESPYFEATDDKENRKITYPNSIKIEFSDKNNASQSWLTADKAVNDITGKKFIFTGNVKLFNKYGDKLEGPELIWDEKKEHLTTDKFIRIIQPSKGDTIFGYGFRANSNFTEFEIKRKLFGKITEDIFSDVE